jgi:hypothetical protein
MKIWIKCSLHEEAPQWYMAVLRRDDDDGTYIDFIDEDLSDDWEAFKKYPVVAVPSLGVYLDLIKTVEWYADIKHYLANGSPGHVVNELGIEMWESDRGRRAADTLERIDMPEERICYDDDV